MIKTAIIGGTGYTGGELLRLLSLHPQASIEQVVSRSMAGQPVHKAHPYLEGIVDNNMTDALTKPEELDMLFLCLPHGTSKEFLEGTTLPPSLKVIDLSRDYREPGTPAPKANPHLEFVYGLVEMGKERIEGASAVANPGCFATLIQLALLPLIQAGGLKDKVHITGITGSTGAGKGLSETSHFSWRDNNLSIYKAFAHQHIEEVEANLAHWDSPLADALYFTPVRGDFTRGMMINLQTAVDADKATLTERYKAFYEDHPLVQVADDGPPALKAVVGSNKCTLHIEQKDDVLLINGMLDNLTKGASGQAVQNMNLMFGLDVNTGLFISGQGY